VRQLAVANGATVTLLGADGVAGPVDASRLDDWARPLRQAGLQVATVPGDGPAPAQALAMVAELGADLLVKGVGPDCDVSRPGAADLDLLRTCPCPVWIVAAGDLPQGMRILATVDPDPEDPVRDGLNRLVLEIAGSLAEVTDARLDVLNVWRLRQEAALRHSLVRIPPEEVERIVAAEERQSAWRLEVLMRDFAGFSDRMTVHHRKGVASEIIPRFVRDQGVDTVVMGTVARSGMKGFSIGQTAGAILGAIDCSVLTVKPEGFGPPVELET
jgi:nucleotide-binding universal stress UspA family protein